MGLFLRNEKYSKILVKIKSLLQSKSTAPSTSTQTITPDSDYDGLSNITVSTIPSSYVQSLGTRSITSNGTYDVKNYASVSVNVAGDDSGSTIVNGTISTAGTAYSLYYFNGSDLVLKELANSDTLSVPKNSIIVVYSSWGTVNTYSTLTNAEQLLTTYSCDCGCGETVALFKVTGSNFKIPLS